MEFIPEGSLEDRLQAGFVTIRESINHIKQILFALEHAHNFGIVHRDVKPGNILLSTPRTKLSDFGTVIHPTSGTEVVDLFYVPHAPPEALNSKNFSQLCDIYAAGITLLRASNNIQDWTACLANIGNWRDVASQGMLAKKIGFQSYVPRALRTILNRACNGDPKDRFQSAAAFRGALEGLRFANDWTQISEDEWNCTKNQRIERMELKIGSKYEVVYTINGRRKNHLCKICKTTVEARSYMEKIVYKTTLA